MPLETSPRPDLRRQLDGWGWATLALLVPYLALCVAGALQTGTSWDESEHRRYGELALDFYRSLGHDRAATTDVMRFYGALHALAGALFERLFSGLHWCSARHLAAVSFGLLGWVYAVRLARLLGGSLAGFVAALVLSATPRWTGDVMFNPVDVPTAALFVTALFYLARLAGSLEEARWSDWIAFGLASGLTLGVRMVGVLLLPYAALLLGLWSLAAPRSAGARWRAHGARLLGGFALAALIAFAAACAFWPRFLVEPVTAIADTLALTARYPWPGKVFFQGQYLTGAEVPRSYLPVWFWLTTPLVTLLGLVLTLLGARAWLRAERGPLLRAGTVAFGLFFPPLYAVATRATVYDGIRHFLFVLPPLSALAALGWARLLRGARARGHALGVAAILAFGALLAEPVIWYARSHPFEYVYFNPLAGGLARASHAYDSEYWGLSLRSAAEWLNEHRVELAGPGATVEVATNSSWHLLEPWLDQPALYRKVALGQPFHVQLLIARGMPPGWNEAAHPVKRKFVVEGQVPFWQFYLGPLWLARQTSDAR